MEKIIVIDCRSTSTNYIYDIRQMGYEPIVMEVYDKRGCEFASYDYTIFGDEKPRVIHSSPDYNKTLELVKEINPKLIIAGNDLGIYLALRLSQDLNLPSTPFENFEKMRDKYICQQALKEAGIRHIKSKLVVNKEEALKFFETLSNQKAVVKPFIGESSVGVYICSNKKEFLDAVDRQFVNAHKSFNKNSILIQEYIDGNEYVVNSVSCNGKHKITALWAYTKKIIPGYAPIYERLDFIDGDSELSKKLIQYDLKVLDAIGMTYGPAHCEFKVDSNGPVLIESNCRIAGGTMNKKFLDKVLGHHETNISLKAYLEPDEFNKLPDVNKLVGHGLMKFLILPYSIEVSKIKLDESLKKIPSFLLYNFGINTVDPNKKLILGKTIDYETCPANIFLINSDLKQLNKDYQKIVDIEENHLDELFDYKKID